MARYKRDLITKRGKDMPMGGHIGTAYVGHRDVVAKRIQRRKKGFMVVPRGK